MTLKTKISAAAESFSGDRREQNDFIAGSNFALGEVRELLLEVSLTLKFYGYGWDHDMPNEVLGMKKDHFGLRAREAIKKIDDSGVLTDEMGE